ncbi:hypothetical protein BDV96DRAFT_603697 [Lophiotrema nucula]|uniref:Uncharacterized protein n=1 Tax=Lophiotrema nucula TaxID=690887 RepID=A0A6A5YUA6_9PLEO|nr:hypothetical protein BDV96DRAFT_603697 [Lophiotrema nucula]
MARIRLSTSHINKIEDRPDHCSEKLTLVSKQPHHTPIGKRKILIPVEDPTKNNENLDELGLTDEQEADVDAYINSKVHINLFHPPFQTYDERFQIPLKLIKRHQFTPLEQFQFAFDETLSDGPVHLGIFMDDLFPETPWGHKNDKPGLGLLAKALGLQPEESRVPGRMHHSLRNVAAAHERLDRAETQTGAPITRLAARVKEAMPEHHPSDLIALTIPDVCEFGFPFSQVKYGNGVPIVRLNNLSVVIEKSSVIAAVAEFQNSLCSTIHRLRITDPILLEGFGLTKISGTINKALKVNPLAEFRLRDFVHNDMVVNDIKVLEAADMFRHEIGHKSTGESPTMQRDNIGFGLEGLEGSEEPDSDRLHAELYADVGIAQAEDATTSLQEASRRSTTLDIGLCDVNTGSTSTRKNDTTPSDDVPAKVSKDSDTNVFFNILPRPVKDAFPDLATATNLSSLQIPYPHCDLWDHVQDGLGRLTGFWLILQHGRLIGAVGELHKFTFDLLRIDGDKILTDCGLTQKVGIMQSHWIVGRLAQYKLEPLQLGQTVHQKVAVLKKARHPFVDLILLRHGRE